MAVTLLRRPMREKRPPEAAVSIERLADLARDGDTAATDRLMVRIYPSVFRLTAAMIGDPGAAEQGARDAFQRALASGERPFTTVVVRQARAIGQERRSGDPGGSELAELDEDDRLVLILLDVDGLSHDRAAAALGTTAGDIAIRHARARAAMGVGLRNSRCVGWALVSRHDRISPPEQEASDRHVEICAECRAAQEDRKRTRLLVLEHLPTPATVARTGAVLATVLGMVKRTSVAAGLGAAAAAAATVALVVARPGSPVAPSTPPPAAAPDAPADTSAEAPVPPDPDADASPDPGAETEAVAASAEPAVPAAGRPAPDVPVAAAPVQPAPQAESADGVSPKPALPALASSRVVGGSPDFWDGMLRVDQHLAARGRDVSILAPDQVTPDRLRAALTSVVDTSRAVALVHLQLEPELSLSGSPSFVVGTEILSVDEVAAMLPADGAMVVVLDLFGPQRVDLDPYVRAFARPGAVVVAGFTPAGALSNGTTNLSATFWDEALIGGAGDADGDGAVSIEEAFRHTARLALHRGVASLPEMDDQLDGPTHLS